VIGIRLAAAAALLAGLGSVPGTVSPQVSVYRQWRIVSHVDFKTENGWSGSGIALVAPSRGQAWALGFTARSGRLASFLEHWNGKRWQLTAVPGVSLEPVAVAASAPDNVWLFSNANRAFAWDGRRWAAAPGTRGMSMADPVVLGPSDVWTLGSGACGQGTLDHWTGSGWSAVTLPGGITALSGSSPRNFWVLTLARTASCRPVRGASLRAYRWNGTSFTRVPIPKIVPGRFVGVAPFTVSSPSDIWIANWSKSAVFHWNGRHWERISLKPEGMPVTPAPIVPDHRGGAWIGGCWHWLGGTWHPIDHFRDSCDETFGLAWIPGTSSAWRLSVGTFGGHSESTMEINGPLP
jgi:hypothetical protein